MLDQASNRWRCSSALARVLHWTGSLKKLAASETFHDTPLLEPHGSAPEARKPYDILIRVRAAGINPVDRRKSKTRCPTSSGPLAQRIDSLLSPGSDAK